METNMVSGVNEGHGDKAVSNGQDACSLSTSSMGLQCEK